MHRFMRVVEGYRAATRIAPGVGTRSDLGAQKGQSSTYLSANLLRLADVQLDLRPFFFALSLAHERHFDCVPKHLGTTR